jgi:hypothetical protein
VEANKGLAQFPEKTVQPEDLTDTAHDPPTQAGFINPYDSSPAIHISNSPWTPPWNPFNTGFTSSEDRLLPTVSLGSGDSASSYTGVLSGANELLGGFSYFMPSLVIRRSKLLDPTNGLADKARFHYHRLRDRVTCGRLHTPQSHGQMQRQYPQPNPQKDAF